MPSTNSHSATHAPRVAIYTLGCDKNTVDSEYIAGLIEAKGGVPLFVDALPTPPGVDAAIVVTCGFTGDAKEESISLLTELAAEKHATGNPARLYAAGCLAQRYATALLQETPELDGVVGVGQFDTLANLVMSLSTRSADLSRPTPDMTITERIPRSRPAGSFTAFLKIADGCNHRCAFCAIPGMKGAYVSTPPDILLEEAAGLVRNGVLEINLVAQDISIYGNDLGQGYHLPDLLQDLCRIDGDFWIRCLYCYPGGVSDALLETMANEPKITPYLDIPIQHTDPSVLKRMRRPDHDMDMFALVKRVRDAVPGVALRTSIITGFPGESPAAHRRLLADLERLAFEWLGVFQYSREEGTPAAVMDHQTRSTTREHRWMEIMNQQAEITEAFNLSRISNSVRVLVEGFEPDRLQWWGRSPSEAPDVDGRVYIVSQRELTPGEFVEAVVGQAEVYDLIAQAK